MAKTWRLILLVAFVVLIAALPSGAQEPKPEPAWCGGSWQPNAVDEKGAVVEAGGSNYGPCVPVTKKVGDKEVTVPTYPAYPSVSVTFQRDDKGNWIGGTVVTETGADGKQTTKWKAIPARVIKR